MAKASKGCVNEDCIAREKRILYKNSDTFCSKCGEPLFYVCKSCGMQLPDNKNRFCIRCTVKRQDFMDRPFDSVVEKIEDIVNNAADNVVKKEPKKRAKKNPASTTDNSLLDK